MKLSPITFAAAGAILASGCHAAKQGGAAESAVTAETAPRLVVAPQPDVQRDERGRGVAVMPRAVVYRMSGPYADNVPVMVNAAGRIVSYPDPSDLGDGSAPVDLGDGWWLDRRGVSSNSVFTKYTYDEYRALKTAPSIAELEAAIIPGAKVCEAVTLPITLPEAEADLRAVKARLPRLRLSL